MWWFIRHRKLVAKFLLVIFISVIVGILFLYGSMAGYQRKIAVYLIKSKAEKMYSEVQETAKRNIYLEDPGKKYNLPTDTVVPDGTRGKGLSLLLVNDIKTEGYVKELLTLYKESAEGKFYTAEHHLSMLSILGLHYNESGTYEGGIILKSYIPADDKGVPSWGKQYRNAPSEAMKLRQLNSKVISLGGLDTAGIDSPTYKNVFQIDRSYFSRKSNLNGYAESNSRSVDPWYIPDGLAYLDQQLNEMYRVYGVDGESPAVMALYGMWHNGGMGSADYFNGLGTSHYNKLKYSFNGGFGGASDKAKAKGNMKRWVLAIPEAIERQVARYEPETFMGVAKGYGVAIWMLLDEGYYISNRLYSELLGSNYALDQLSAGYNAIHGTKLNRDGIKKVLKASVKEPWEVHSSYMTQDQFYTTYGRTSDAIEKGTIWKLEDETSDVYKNKINGKNARVLHRVNWEMAGFAYDLGYRGTQVYEAMLKYAGVDVDKTNPANYYQDKNNQFVPPAGNFATALTKIGVTVPNAEVYAMLQEAYKVSGWYYRFGGSGQFVTQENYSEIASLRASSSDMIDRHRESLINEIYRTKDGTSAAIASNRRNSNLVGYNKQVFDCSGFIAWAYNNTIGKTKGKILSQGTANQITSSLLTTISKSSIQAGDILVRRSNGDGHVVFYLGNKQGVVLNSSETKTNESVTVRGSGYFWSLEAYNTGYITGIRSRRVSPDYVARRFN